MVKNATKMIAVPIRWPIKPTTDSAKIRLLRSASDQSLTARNVTARPGDSTLGTTKGERALKRGLFCSTLADWCRGAGALAPIRHMHLVVIRLAVLAAAAPLGVARGSLANKSHTGVFVSSSGVDALKSTGGDGRLGGFATC
jgi:hypothetical protein